MTSTTTTAKVWLITGCSTGLGKELAFEALKRGDKVIATARSTAKLTALVEAGAHPLQLDVTSPEPELEALAKQAVDIYGGIDVLVNNAGYVLQGAIEAASHEETLSLFNTNVFGLLNVTRAFLPHFRSRQSGVIAIIGSMAGRMASPGVGLYGATKFALEGITEALHAEVAPLGINVTIIEPGMFRTALLAQGSNLNTTQRHIADYDQTAGKTIEFLEMADGKQPGDPVKAAQRIVDVLTRTGSAADRKEIPLRLALGQDAFDGIKKKTEEALAELESWKPLSLGTEHEDANNKQM